MLIANLAVSGAMVVVTFLVHFIGLVLLSGFLRGQGHHPATLTTVFGQGVSILFIVLMLFVLHSVEVFLYACLYMELGAVVDFEAALYFSTSTFTTVGFGDLTLDADWRMLAAVESMNGFLLIGWSTAFLVSVTAKVRVFQATVEHMDD